MLLTLLLLIPIPMMLAVLMESRLTKAKGVWKVIMYIPALTSVVNAFAWKCQYPMAERKDYRMDSFVITLYVEMDRC